MDLLENAVHGLHNVSFVDSFVAHVPIYPPDLTITVALWSTSTNTSWRDHLKRVPLIDANSANLKKLAIRAGLTRALDVKKVEYFDFHPTSEGFKGLKERKEFPRGPSCDYLCSLFYVLQQTGNEGLGRVATEHIDSPANVENRSLVQDLVARLEAGNPIEPRLSENHYDIPFANFTTDEIHTALAVQNGQ